jgi:hypothetical protein
LVKDVFGFLLLSSIQVNLVMGLIRFMVFILVRLVLVVVVVFSEMRLTFVIVKVEVWDQ